MYAPPHLVATKLLHSTLSGGCIRQGRSQTLLHSCHSLLEQPEQDKHLHSHAVCMPPNVYIYPSTLLPLAPDRSFRQMPHRRWGDECLFYLSANQIRALHLE